MNRLATLFALLLSAVATAQDKPKSGDLKVRFLAERMPPDLGQVLMATPEEKSAAFDIRTNSLSEPQAAPARVFAVKQATGKETSLANVTLPDAGKSFIVLLIPGATGYKPVVISAEDASFKAGDVYFYNHGDKPVLGYVGTATFILQPGKGQTLTPKGAKEGKYYDVGFGVREKEGDKALSTTRWPVEDKLRSYVFFFVNPTTKLLDFRAVDEFIEPEKKPGT
ncbi:hypothetical protein OKA04_08495 [Luteolibacter flavescens]|uniref:Uncharacterized protein n=1 Tax=Luteolibacter flavescens TaxID=1859460 RepID=A0ABT3FMG4_9BACT|nr:hypothetical protein [Luteolibacter flavescens]MCW1884765.1 hypothetical protein [Luteolibacter flavescens]